ncbi:hypothetical protein A1O3_05547 [Capronia epimyces CBS 606.96]|uniref:Small EDRK-rich factor-like N-terminal domain-containing protein n=1 Tax=Capronia epimyces CBS 606.96 TaxID=1182542 RepID=W9XWF9_9EURO|nr:uncharacterized protein A1O3_05547 [Capronia epimyces CBS 606.96]EXJ84872.1 hypothetical protein A1O3_05547 [Capronia epimyces CBS 606.96]
MARGNQREKAREKNLKEQASTKKKNSLSGTEFQRTKEAQAAIMREKQAKGGFSASNAAGWPYRCLIAITAEAAKAQGGAATKKN